jgi:diguanylate cyclase (GGDEF)-like protein
VQTLLPRNLPWRAYALLARLLYPQRYLGKVFLLTFLGIHVPLLALTGYLLLSLGLGSDLARMVFLVALVATLVGSAATLLGLWILLSPIAAASSALRAYQAAGRLPALPTDLTGEPGELLADVHHTLTHLDRHVQDLARQALQDPLTGSPNRRAFEQQVTAELATAVADDRQVALVVVDVDGLKQINDQCGHAAGDAALRQVAVVLARHFGEYGWIARWGGDEFVAIVREALGSQRTEALLTNVRDELARATVSGCVDGVVELRVSGGVARADQAASLHELFQQADQALYSAKRADPESTQRVVSIIR